MTTIQLGVIGPGDRGTYVMTRFQQDPHIHVAALCDVYADKIDRVKSKAAPNAKSFKDHRKMVELKKGWICSDRHARPLAFRCAIDA